ncbi:MAG: hypothetical protein ACRCYQ_02190 [Nocardioides sp.]
MSSKAARVDDRGVHPHPGFRGSADVYFDDQRVWSFAADRASGEGVVRWPQVLKRLLDGHARVRVQSDDQVLFDDLVQFGESSARLRFVDDHGTPIIIDKWGLIQRPLEARRAAGVVDAMAGMAEEILRVMSEDCGIDGWIAFGTLLGAARDGRAIGHDSDIDLCFLSDAATPAAMIGELWSIARALRARGIPVQHKAGCFVTARFKVPDGGYAGIDIYTCFYLDGLLYETATIRSPMPIEAILPLGVIEFEGRMMPAPADPEALLALSYGPNWRVPDPSFQHQPSAATVNRFDQWFGSLMQQRRAWRHANNERAGRCATAVSPFARWVVARVPPGARLIELGSGSGRDLRFYARRGLAPTGMDYAPPSKRRAAGPGPALSGRGEPVAVPRVQPVNFYDLRDTLSMGAMLARARPQAICARELFETLAPDGRDNCVRMIGMALRGGGTALVEGRVHAPSSAATWQATAGGGKVWSLEPAVLADAFEAVGGTITDTDGSFGGGPKAVGPGGRGPSRAPARWRMVVEW